MDDTTRERIAARIAQLEREMAAFVEEANRQIAMQQGGIAALRQLLAEAEEAPPDDDAAQVIAD